MPSDACIKRPRTKTASRIVIYLSEELGDARLRAAQLKRYVKEATDLIEKSPHRDHFFEVAAHLIQGIPEALFKLEKALDAAAMATARLDYEEIKQGLKPEKAEELDAVMEDTRLRYLNRRSHEDDMLTPKDAAAILNHLAARTEAEGRVPVAPMLTLIARLEAGDKGMDRAGTYIVTEPAKAVDFFKEAAEAILGAKAPSRRSLASVLRRVLADTIQPTAGAMAAAILSQASSREDVMEGFKSANPDLTEAQLKEIADQWEANKDVVKDKQAAADHQAALVLPSLERLFNEGVEAVDQALKGMDAYIDTHTKIRSVVKAAEYAEDDDEKGKPFPGAAPPFGKDKEASEGDKASRFKEDEDADKDGDGVPDNITDPKDKADWKAKNEEHGDKFKKDAKLMSRQEAILKKYVWSGGDAMFFDDLPANVKSELRRVKDQETIDSDVDRWLGDNNNPHTRSMWAASTDPWKVGTEGGKDAMFPAGKPADPKKNMTEEQKAEWDKQNKIHGEKFKKDKEASDPWTERTAAQNVVEDPVFEHALGAGRKLLRDVAEMFGGKVTHDELSVSSMNFQDYSTSALEEDIFWVYPEWEGVVELPEHGGKIEFHAIGKPENKQAPNEKAVYNVWASAFLESKAADRLAEVALDTADKEGIAANALPQAFEHMHKALLGVQDEMRATMADRTAIKKRLEDAGEMLQQYMGDILTQKVAGGRGASVTVKVFYEATYRRSDDTSAKGFAEVNVYGMPQAPSSALLKKVLDAAAKIVAQRKEVVFKLGRAQMRGTYWRVDFQLTPA